MDGARYLEDGRLTIFKRDGVFYARIRLTRKRYVWRSLKTSDEATAVRAGRKLLFQIEHRADAGLPAKSKTFNAVIDDYVRFRERDHQHGKTSAGMLRQVVRVATFWREYAGHLAIDAVDDRVMREFIPWRRDYYLSIRQPRAPLFSGKASSTFTKLRAMGYFNPSKPEPEPLLF